MNNYSSIRSSFITLHMHFSPLSLPPSPARIPVFDYNISSLACGRADSSQTFFSFTFDRRLCNSPPPFCSVFPSFLRALQSVVKRSQCDCFLLLPRSSSYILYSRARPSRDQESSTFSDHKSSAIRIVNSLIIK